MSGPLVSVVIPAYNAAKYISATLDSLYAQTYKNFEIVVVDDGSTDDTPAVLAAHGDRIVSRRQVNGGLAAARNTGLELARGEMIALMDADDICMPERLVVQAAYLAHNPEVVALASDFTAFEGETVFDESHASTYYSVLKQSPLPVMFEKTETFDGQGVPWLAEPLSKAYKVYFGNVWRRLVFGNFMHPPTLMFRREARERAGWLRHDVKSVEDWEYVIRLSKLGPLAFIDDRLLAYRYHDRQMSARTETSLLGGNIRVLESTLEADGHLLPELRPALIERLASFHSEVAYALAESDRINALVHLFHAARLDVGEARLPFNLARILTPRTAFRLLRKLRGKDSGTLRRS